MTDRREWMLILDADRLRPDLTPYRVTQQVSPRVLIIEPAESAAKEELMATEGVEAVLEPGEIAADEIRGTLTPTEALFVEAFIQRARQKERPGEGLNWDAAGFLPPDPPHRR